MNRVEQVAHYRSAFRQGDEMTKIELVRSLRDIAIECVTPVLAELPRPISDEARETLLADGVDTEWNLKVADDAIVFFLVAKDADVSASTKSAAQLLSACTHVLEEPSLLSQMENCILDAYAGIEHDNIQYGLKHRTEQKARAKKPRGKLNSTGVTMQEVIRKLALSHEFGELSAKELWGHLHSALDNLGANPVEVQNKKLPENPHYNYNPEGSAVDKLRAISFKQFANSVSKVRKNHSPS